MRVDPLRGDDVPRGGVGPAGQRVGLVEAGEPVGGGVGVAHRGSALAVGGQRHRGRYGVVAVGGLADGVGVGDDRDAGRGDDAVVGTAVGGATTAVAVDDGVEACVDLETLGAGPGQGGAHDDTVAGRVGQVAGGEGVAVGRAGRGDRALHPGRVGGHRVGEVAALEVGEGVPVGDDVLEGVHVRVVDRGLVDVGEHAVGHGEPDLGRGGPGRADAVLAGEVEVAEGPGRAGCLPRRRGRAGGGGGEQGEHDARGSGDRVGASQWASSHGGPSRVRWLWDRVAPHRPRQRPLLGGPRPNSPCYPVRGRSRAPSRARPRPDLRPG